MMETIMNKLRAGLVVGVLVFLLCSCEQYAIFDAIAQEVKPKPALIMGVVSNIVKDSAGDLYVANGELWKFKDSQWKKVPTSSNVRDVAVVGMDVYVISVGGSPSLSELGGGTIAVPTGTVQGIYGANDTLFVAVGNGSSYSVYAYKNSGFLSDPVVANGLLKGAAHYTGNYYLATSTGLYHSTDGATFDSIESRDFLGVIARTNKVVAVTEAAVYEVSDDVPTEKVSGDSLTGALAVSGDTLYLGRSRGYRIIDDTTASSWELDSPSTAANYNSTIAQVQVTSMYAVSDDLIFASVLSSETKRRGLMSLRDDSWNMEE
jgi:hypothetical protein